MFCVLFDLMDTLVRADAKPRDVVWKTLGYLSPHDADHAFHSICISRPGLDEESFFATLWQTRSRLISQSAYHDAVDAWRACMNSAAFVEGAKETIIGVKRMGHRVGIVSNALPPTKRVLEQLKLETFVDHIVLSCDHGRLKPDPRLFFVALNQLRTEPSDALFIGNRIDTDVLGSIAARIRPILIANCSNPGRFLTDIIVVDRLTSIPALLQDSDTFIGRSSEPKALGAP